LRTKSGQCAPRVGVNQLLKDLEHLVRVHPSLHENEFHLTRSWKTSASGPMARRDPDLAEPGGPMRFNAPKHPHRVEVSGEVLREPLDLTAFKDGPKSRLLNIESMDNTAPGGNFPCATTATH